jgi:glutamyl-tRNA reductase
LQHQAEEMRQAELHRMHARLETLTAEQAAAVEALTHGLMNKFLHPPMQAFKQAAREGDSAKLEALCDAWSIPAALAQESVSTSAATQPEKPEPENGKNLPMNKGCEEVRR